MATRRTTSNGNAPKFGVPTGNFLKLSQDTNKVGPYVITDKLSVPPATKKRSEAMRDAQQRAVAAQAQVNIAYALAQAPPPLLPAPPDEIPVPDGDVAADVAEDIAARNAAAKADYRLDIVEWKQDVRQWKANLDVARQQISEYTAAGVQAEQDYERAALGPQHDDIVEFFDELDESLWAQFRDALNKYWVASQPADEFDADDPEEAGKARKSSTG